MTNYKYFQSFFYCTSVAIIKLHIKQKNVNEQFNILSNFYVNFQNLNEQISKYIYKQE
jgi:hypothetical protein